MSKERTCEEAGVEGGEMPKEVIRHETGYYTFGQGSGLTCSRCGKGLYVIKEVFTDIDADGKKTITELYECSNENCKSIWEFEVYKED